MKHYLLATIVAASAIFAAKPAVAAGFEDAATVRSGTFTGARIRFSLGGGQHSRKFRAGLTIAPTFRSQSSWGSSRTRFGEGLELGFVGERPLAVSLGGRPVSRLLPGGSKSKEDTRLGTSTGGYVAIGAGVVLVAGAIVLGVLISNGDALDDS